MNRENFLFKTISISDDQFAIITREIKKYYSIIEHSEQAKHAKHASANHRTVFNVDIPDLLKNCPNLLRYIFLTLNSGQLYEIKYIHRFAKETQLPHIDYVTEDFALASDNYLALNFPVKNCQHCRVYFCEPVGKIKEEKRYLGKNYRAKMGFHDDWKILGEYYLTTPTLINTNVYHNIENETDDTRISLSIRFKKNPWHLV